MKKSAFIAAVMLCLASCSNSSLDGTWTVSKLGNDDVPETLNIPQLSIDSSKGTYSGCTGVNRLNGEIELMGNTLHFKEGAMTRMSADTESMMVEVAYLVTLEYCHSFEIEGDTLKLLDKDKKVLMQLSR